MSAETRTPVIDTLSDPMDPTLAQYIAHGLHVPTYDEFAAYGDYVRTFQPTHSSRNNGSPIVYSRQGLARGDAIHLSAEEYTLAAQAARPEYWQLSDDDTTSVGALLAAKNLAQVPGSGRHYSPRPEDDKETLHALQEDARKRVALDHGIRLAQVWANSHHGVRFGLEGTMPDSATVSSLAARGLRERLSYVAATPQHPDDAEHQYVSVQNEQPTPTEAPARHWHRLKNLGRRILSLF